MSVVATALDSSSTSAPATGAPAALTTIPVIVTPTGITHSTSVSFPATTYGSSNQWPRSTTSPVRPARMDGKRAIPCASVRHRFASTEGADAILGISFLRNAVTITSAAGERSSP